MALPLPPDAVSSTAQGINDVGQIVGTVRIDNAVHAFVWTLEGGMTDIGALTGSAWSYATAINSAGQVAGGIMDASGHIRAFRWSQSEGIVELPMPAGTRNSRVRGINAAGEVVGERDGADLLLPFRWSQAKGTEDLALFDSDSYGAALAINDNGDVAGYSGGFDYYHEVVQAAVWLADGTKKIVDACTAGHTAWDGTYICYSSANAINSAGQIAGTSEVAGSSRAFRLSLNAGNQAIPGILGSFASTPSAINEAGQVVGSSSWMPSQAGRGFLWSPAGGTIDLGALPGRQQSQATGINNHGQVVGNSY
jgi:probable HAF family extracellular repeat protein